ncbi:MAG TPA: dienelactone hydrolase family protein [Polyangiaceae bacterium]|nr:dienelactone hydrolase family protein [Polyangiaceae bacterium]
MRKVVLGGLEAFVGGGTDGKGRGDGPVVVLLHGYGAPGTDLVPLADAIRVPSSVRFVFPMAPIVLAPGIPDEFAARAWWPIDMLALQVAIASGQHRAIAQQDPAGLTEAREQVLALLEALENELRVAPEQIVLGGFSQGAMLATDVALRSDRRLAGLVILSGTLMAEPVWNVRVPLRRGLPVLQSHGASDPILPFAAAETLQQRLTEAGLPVKWMPFAGGHGIPAPVLAELGRFIAALTGGAP